jgi:arylsulfatase A-like enzyme
MNRLADAGYQTHGVGKMHFGPDARALWGFDSRDYFEEGGGNDDFRAVLDANGYGHVVLPRGERSEYAHILQPLQLPERLHHADWIADRTLDLLDRRDAIRPFFLWASVIKPHPPFEWLVRAF